MKRNTLFTLIGLLASALMSAQGSLQFNEAKIISGSTETVPAGKVWKVTAVYGTAQQCNEIGPCYTALSPTSYAFANVSGMMVNGTVIQSKMLWKRTSFYTNSTCVNDPRSFSGTGTCNNDAKDVSSDPNILPIWLPEGTTLSSLGSTSFVSVIEFNVISE